ncbi:hypothetical protein K1T35_48435 (plasmid) [Pseudonocardia sp. DSM 110487]|uniref:hypothetical protein n=1 Tax=Pseudonocardia sp. DSM 110487 TaxID=2865833 RepID=UPI001C697150|nr:hypothetical protein [Pseudonocardia sp. DSM 110487]QYN41177.1 hypothetical protein K1T35_48435 [Pseudonocardia sp. DSM 110487]
MCADSTAARDRAIDPTSPASPAWAIETIVEEHRRGDGLDEGWLFDIAAALRAQAGAPDAGHELIAAAESAARATGEELAALRAAVLDTLPSGAAIDPDRSTGELIAELRHTAPAAPTHAELDPEIADPG